MASLPRERERERETAKRGCALGGSRVCKLVEKSNSYAKFDYEQLALAKPATVAKSKHTSPGGVCLSMASACAQQVASGCGSSGELRS